MLGMFIGLIVFVIMIGLAKAAFWGIVGLFVSRPSNEPSTQIRQSPREYVETLNDEQFISYVQKNYNALDEVLTIDGTGGGHGIEKKYWSTSKYSIVSQVDTNDFNDYVTITRKSDGKKIFSGTWRIGRNYE